MPTSKRSYEGDDMANVELIEKILKHIDEEPKRLDMNAWVKDRECGTTACVAGWACILDGRATWSAVDGWVPEGDNGEDDGAWARQGMYALGISEGLASWLFHTFEDTALNVLYALRDGASESDVLRPFGGE